MWEKTGCWTIQCKEHENSKVGKKMNVGLHVKQIAQVMNYGKQVLLYLGKVGFVFD